MILPLFFRFRKLNETRVLADEDTAADSLVSNFSTTTHDSYQVKFSTKFNFISTGRHKSFLIC